LVAAQYYCEHVSKIQEIISKLDPETSIAIGKAQNIMQNETLKNNLIFISVNFSFIAHTITKLETKNMSLNDSMQIVESAIEKLLVSRPIGDVVKNKIHAVTEKNPGYIDFKTINDIMSGRHSSKNLELSPSDIMRFKYAPITSVDVEQSFKRNCNNSMQQIILIF